MTRSSRSLLVLLSLCATIVAGLATASTAGAARNLDYGFVEDQFADNLLTNANAAISNEWWDKNEKTNSDVVRVNLYWSQVAGPIEPADPTNPRDPRYDWSVPDAALLNAKRRGIDVVFTVFLAPRWAEGPNRPASEDVSRIGTWRPDPDRFRDFAEAVATRYSGKLRQSAAGQVLRGLERAEPAAVHHPAVERQEAGVVGDLPRADQRLLRGDQGRQREGQGDRRRHLTVRRRSGRQADAPLLLLARAAVPEEPQEAEEERATA